MKAEGVLHVAVTVRRCAAAAAVWMAAIALCATARAQAPIAVSAPPALAAAAERVRAVDMARLNRALAAAGLELPDQVRAILLEGDDPRAAALPDWIAGLAVAPRDIVIFPTRARGYPYDSLESVVRHEIAHLALDARAQGRPLPRWFHEGVAVSVDEGWNIEGRMRLLVAVLDRPPLRQVGGLFDSDRESDARQAYLLATVLVHDIRRRHGHDVPGRIAARVAEGLPFPRAFQDVTHETPDEAAEQAWAAYRRWSAWVPAITSASATWTFILLLAVVAFISRMRYRAKRRRAWDDDDEGNAADTLPET